MSTLAIHGGSPAITRTFERYNPIGIEERAAVQRVIDSGILSQFLADWHPDFYGGPQIQALERSWERHFGIAHAVAVNSNTSGLIAAIGALGIEPGDEVIVSPWTMSASATAILIWNAIPVFADIEAETFNIDPAAIERQITAHTRALMVVDVFGHPADMDAIRAIARKHRLRVIEDCAQAPGARYKDRYAGTLGDIGVFSLNRHKHIHTGEGGVCVTNDARLAERLQLIRNHAESVVGDKGVAELDNMIGFNFRMTEIEAAIGNEQLKKLSAIVAERQTLAGHLTRCLTGLVGLQLPVVKAGCTHAYYVYPMVIDVDAVGVSRARLIDALRAEGVSIEGGYCNVHLLPMYQRRIAYGRHGYPWIGGPYRGSVNYAKGICPTAESLHDRGLCYIGMCEFAYTSADIELVSEAFHKVWANLERI
jgi:perosamine synthetase